MDILEPASKANLSEARKEDAWGTVMAVQANFYDVQLSDGVRETEGVFCTRFLCTRRSRLKKIGQKVMVGDRVLIEEMDPKDGRGVIVKVAPRKSELKRPRVANVDQILLVFALEEPKLDPWQMSRFLIKAEATQLSICLCLNKTDLLSESELEGWKKRLEHWGYDPVFISVTQGWGLEQLADRLAQKMTIVAGPSGVGKSSLINHLIPEAELRVGDVSGKLQRGRHTTRHVELFPLPKGGLLADSPGFNKPDIDCFPSELPYYFPEARKRIGENQCKFNNCLHRDEPNCAIAGDWERYEHYLEFLAESQARQEALEKQPDEEASLKLKIKGAGEKYYEPRLESKKYRRRSRRLHNQQLQNALDELED